jgi:hypothetical protein
VPITEALLEECQREVFRAMAVPRSFLATHPDTESGFRAEVVSCFEFHFPEGPR